jgi:hypothetical protein
VLFSYLYSGLIETLCVAISFLSIYADNSSARTAAEVFAVAASASLLVVPTLVAAALIRTASGTTFTAPCEFTVIYRFGAACADGAITAAIAIVSAAIAEIRVRVVMYLLAIIC